MDGGGGVSFATSAARYPNNAFNLVRPSECTRPGLREGVHLQGHVVTALANAAFVLFVGSWFCRIVFLRWPIGLVSEQ